MKTIVITWACALLAVACAKTLRTPAPAPNEKEVAMARAKFPDVTEAQLKQGHSIFYGPCTHCHQPKDVSNFSEKKMSRVLDRMAKKAKLSASQKEAVWRYLAGTQIKQ